MNNDAQLSASLNPLLQAGLPTDAIRQIFDSAKGVFKFNTQGIYDFYIDEMMKRKRFIPPLDFVKHCRSFTASGSASESQRQFITAWLQHVGQLQDSPVPPQAQPKVAPVAPVPQPQHKTQQKKWWEFWK